MCYAPSLASNNPQDRMFIDSSEVIAPCHCYLASDEHDIAEALCCAPDYVNTVHDSPAMISRRGVFRITSGEQPNRFRGSPGGTALFEFLATAAGAGLVATDLDRKSVV